jgi:hypothetical protein
MNSVKYGEKLNMKLSTLGFINFVVLQYKRISDLQLYNAKMNKNSDHFYRYIINGIYYVLNYIIYQGKPMIAVWLDTCMA